MRLLRYEFYYRLVFTIIRLQYVERITRTNNIMFSVIMLYNTTQYQKGYKIINW